MPLSAPQISRPARRTVREAFEDLERTISPLEAKSFEGTTLQNVQKAALDIENQLSARGSLRNMRRLMPLFSGLEHYSKSIEILCNGTPYLPWVWAPIKLILQIASDYVLAFERIVAAYSRIAESLTRFEILSKALTKSPEIQETLAIFYADILRFHREAYVFVRRSGWKIFFLSSWGRFQRRFDTIIDDLKAHEKLIDKTANAVNVSDAAKMRKDLREWRRASLEDLAKKENEDFNRQYQAIVAWLKLDDTDQQVIFDSIASEGNKHFGTCVWIFKQNNLSLWMKDGPEIPFLWLEGHPGTGKSVMATQVDRFMRSNDTSIVVRHFCTYSYASSIQYDQILRSLLAQLVRLSNDLVAHVYDEYVSTQKAVTITALDQLVLTISGAVSSTSSKLEYIHIVVDGLDECEGEIQGRVANLLERLVSSASSGSTICKVLLASRPSPVLSKRFRKKPTVSLAEEKRSIEGAMTIYCNQKLGLLRYRLSQLGMTDGDLKEVSMAIVQRADGMFLWARLILEYLSSNMFFNQDEVKLAINTLPRKLSEFYGRILSQVTARFDARSISRMKSILGWIAFAKRPLKKAECRSALYFSESDTNNSRIPPPYIFDICAPLIQENKDTTFSFVHVSVKDYLQTAESVVFLQEADAQYEHAFASIACLVSAFDVFDPTYDTHNRNLRLLGGLHGFHIHANTYWDEYLFSSCYLGGRLDPNSPLHSIASSLAKKLNHTGSFTLEMTNEESTVVDSRIQCYVDDEEILHMLQVALRKRKAEIQGVPLLERGDYSPTFICVDDKLILSVVPAESADLANPRDLKELQAKYQFILRDLLSLRAFPGVSFEELEKFKTEFGTSAFTCFFSTCPRAASGFQNEAAMLQHELTHTQTIICIVQGCQYPPFGSSQALKAHVAKCHKETDKAHRATKIRAANRNTKGSYGYDPDRTETSPSRAAAFSSESSLNIQGNLEIRLVKSIQLIDRASFAEFSLCGKNLAIVTPAGLRVYDTETFECLSVIPVYTLTHVCFFPKNKHLAIVTRCRIGIWEILTGKLVCEYDHCDFGDVTSIDIPRQEGSLIASGSSNKTVCVWSLRNRTLSRPWKVQTAVECVAISSTGEYVVAATTDNLVSIWRVQEGRTFRTFLGAQKDIRSVAFSPDSKAVLAGGLDGVVYWWDLHAPVRMDGPRIFQGHKKAVVSVAAILDSTWVFSSSADGEIWLWNSQSGKSRHESKAQSNDGTFVSVSSTGSFFAILSPGLPYYCLNVWTCG
ncbi:hypothetical protein AK830_g9237 [Neonectria ditissima]|uniref:Uncharacterized protein n=1 Tax=Neonectria ditissima TaxID=78410 RepID=A0A0P7AS63_9HYPO|nr:hypothetical protein AK830_g9237 [Neonectria ditissima]